MTKWRLFHLKNEMLAANSLANFIGAFLVQGLIYKAETPFPESLFVNPIAYYFDMAFYGHSIGLRSGYPAIPDGQVKPDTYLAPAGKQGSSKNTQ